MRRRMTKNEDRRAAPGQYIIVKKQLYQQSKPFRGRIVGADDDFLLELSQAGTNRQQEVLLSLVMRTSEEEFCRQFDMCVRATTHHQSHYHLRNRMGARRSFNFISVKG